MKARKTRSYGLEHEWSNIPKAAVIPAILGHWESKGKHAEVDIINFYDGAFETAWPHYPYGGEINTQPTFSSYDQVSIADQLFNLLTKAGPHPVIVSPVSATHIHVRDKAFLYVECLKDLYGFILRNQDVCTEFWMTLDAWRRTKKAPGYHPGGYGFMRNANGKKLSATYQERVTAARNVVEFGEALVPRSEGSGKLMWGNANRQGVNLHALRHNGTVEFRWFRGTVDTLELASMLDFVDEFLNRALNHGEDFTREELEEHYTPAPLDPHGFFANPAWAEAQEDWWSTRQERQKVGKKTRIGYIEAL